MQTKMQRAMSGIIGRAGAAVGMRPRGSVDTPWLSANKWIDELNTANLPPVRGSIAIVAFRNQTWIEWASYTAAWMRQIGLAPIVFYSGRDTNRLYGGGLASMGPAVWLEDSGFWQTIQRIPDAKFIDLNAMPGPTADQLVKFSDFAKDYAHTSAAYDLRVEELEGWPREDDYAPLCAVYEKKLADFAARIDAALKQVADAEIKRMILYSGLIDVTAAAGEAARRAGLDVMFVEGWAIKRGHMLCSLNQPALVYDIHAWLKSLGEWDESHESEIDEFLKFQENPDLTDAEWLADYHQFQRSKSTDSLPDGVRRFIEADDRRLLLLTPNVVGDSATLRSRTIFRSQADWIQQVCEHLKGRSDVKLLVRAHPDEHFLGHKVVVKMGQIAEQASAGIENIHVVRGDEDVSTYALIPHTSVGLIWLSTVGVDMTVRDVPVLAGARPKYHGLGIVREPESIADYFVSLDAMIDQPPVPTAEQKHMCRRYLTILAKEFSYEATSPHYRARGIHLAGHDPEGDIATFYKILAGDLPSASRPPARSRTSPET